MLPSCSCKMKEDQPLTKAKEIPGEWADGPCEYAHAGRSNPQTSRTPTWSASLSVPAPPRDSCCKDPGLCCAVLCCDPITTGQLYERAVRKGLLERVPAATCMSVAVFLWVAFALNSVLNGSANPYAAGVGQLVGLCANVIVFLIVCSVRGAIRKRDGIPPQVCGEAEDCCCSFWCVLCTQCQLWRHEKVACPDYSLCSPTGAEIEV